MKYPCDWPYSLPQITDDERNEYEEAFVLFDKNGDGYVSQSELEDVLRHLGAGFPR